MKKKTLTHYPSIPSPKVQQFTLYQLSIQLFKQKQFTKGLQKFISNCMITTNSICQNLNQKDNNVNALNKSLSIGHSPKSSTGSTNLNSNRKLQKNTNKKQQRTFQIQQIQPIDQQQQLCEFIFQNQVKNRMLYPWMLNQNGNNQMIECNVITDQISDVIQQTIQSSLHKILNKEFINVTNQILAMRQEINIFTKQQLERTDMMKLQMQRQFQKMNKKIQQQQHISTSILHQPLQRFNRSKGVLLNTNQSFNSTKQSKKSESTNNDDGKMSVHHEIFTLKKQIQMLKKNISPLSNNSKMGSTETTKHLDQKISIIQQKLHDLTLSQKLINEQQKQKCKKNYELLNSQIAINSSKQFISQQIKKGIKSNLKIYLDEIMKCKKDIQQLYQRIQRYDKGMQEYLGNQLKNVWTLVSGVKTRVENIQEQFGVGMDQSFVL